MKYPITINGKTYRLKFFEYLAYQNQVRIERLEKKLNDFLKKSGNKCADKSTDNGDAGANKSV